jgi:hypothetical protein
MLTEFKMASFRREAFWKRDRDEAMFAEGGPAGGKDGVEIVGDETEDPSIDCVLVRDCRDGLELEEPNGRLIEVAVRVTVRLLGLATSEVAKADCVLVKVNV